MADSDIPVKYEAECSSCGEFDSGRCPVSMRQCGHHCNHIWSHDACCWCGEEADHE